MILGRRLRNGYGLFYEISPKVTRNLFKGQRKQTRDSGALQGQFKHSMKQVVNILPN